MSFVDMVSYTSNSVFRKRVRMATVIAATEVQGESQGDMPDSAYAKRQDLARRVLTTAGEGTPTDDIARMFLWATVANAAITPDSDDGSIQFQVNAIWGDCAGVTGNETA